MAAAPFRLHRLEEDVLQRILLIVQPPDLHPLRGRELVEVADAQPSRKHQLESLPRGGGGRGGAACSCRARVPSPSGSTSLSLCRAPAAHSAPRFSISAANAASAPSAPPRLPPSRKRRSHRRTPPRRR